MIELGQAKQTVTKSVKQVAIALLALNLSGQMLSAAEPKRELNTPSNTAKIELSSYEKVKQGVGNFLAATILPVTIKKNDTLSSIAKAFYEDPERWKEIQDFNNIKNPNDIKIGETIYITKFRSDDLIGGETTPTPPTRHVTLAKYSEDTKLKDIIPILYGKSISNELRNSIESLNKVSFDTPLGDRITILPNDLELGGVLKARKVNLQTEDKTDLETQNPKKATPKQHKKPTKLEKNENYQYAQIGEKLIDSLIQRESSGNPAAIGGQGEIGLMQVKPKTAIETLKKNNFDLIALARSSSIKIEDRSDIEIVKDCLLVPELNKMIGTAYLIDLAQEFKDPTLTLMAYNAGPNHIRASLRETNGDIEAAIYTSSSKSYNYAKDIIKRSQS